MGGLVPVLLAGCGIDGHEWSDRQTFYLMRLLDADPPRDSVGVAGAAFRKPVRQMSAEALEC